MHFKAYFCSNIRKAVLSFFSQVIFPLWTKWLVTNPMPTQYWHEVPAQGLAHTTVY